jgi:hypothetical protein
MQKCKKNLLDGAVAASNITDDQSICQFPFKNKGFTPDSHYIYEKTPDLGTVMPDFLSTPVNIAANSGLF